MCKYAMLYWGLKVGDNNEQAGDFDAPLMRAMDEQSIEVYWFISIHGLPLVIEICCHDFSLPLLCSIFSIGAYHSFLVSH